MNVYIWTTEVVDFWSGQLRAKTEDIKSHLENRQTRDRMKILHYSSQKRREGNKFKSSSIRIAGGMIKQDYVTSTRNKDKAATEKFNTPNYSI